MANRVNQLHFYQPFDIDKDFIAIKIFTTNGKTYKPGEIFDKNSMPVHKVKVMWNTRKIAYADSLLNPATIAAVVESSQPEIVKGNFGWLYIEKDGKRIGKPTRDMEEAERLLEECLVS